MIPATQTMTPAEVAAWEEMARTGELYKYARVQNPRAHPNQAALLRRYQAVLAERAGRYER